jgi:multiple sugar transport system substrate-binding protein
MRGKPRRVIFLAGFICLALAAAAVAVAKSSSAPIGHFPGVTLTLSRWSGDPWETQTRTAASQWDAATGGTLNVDAVPYENLNNKQVLQLSSHSGGYDILYVHPGWFGEYAKAGYLKPIGSYLANKSLNPPGFAGASAYLPSILKQGAYNGQQYCLQDFVGTVLLAYRTDVFKKYHLAPPTTWAQVAADAKFLNGKQGMAGITLAGKRTGAVSDTLSSMLISLGTWWYNAADKPSLSTKKATQAISFYVQLAKYAPSGILNYHFDQVAIAAAQGKAAMMIANTPSIARLNDPTQSKTVGKWGYVPLAATASKPAGELIYWNWCVSADSKDPQAAYSFIQWFTSGSQQALFAPQSATAGATKDFYANKSLAKKMPFLPAMQAALKNTEPQPSLSKWPQIQDQIELAVQNAIQHKLTPNQAARSMQATLKANLG